MKSLSIPLATSREELKRNLAGKAKADLLEMELDTLGEDWLMALQEELTKPYFLTVSPDLFPVRFELEERRRLIGS